MVEIRKPGARPLAAQEHAHSLAALKFESSTGDRPENVSRPQIEIEIQMSI
jgi:hypothetical protein